jgi:site-specific DNA recombinase
MHVMMRQMMALFDEYQSKENGKENARQGFWNGARAPIGYRIVAAEQRGAMVKKKLEIDPLHADTVRLIYRLALERDGASGPMDVKNITTYLNQHRIFTRDGARWGIGAIASRPYQNDLHRPARIQPTRRRQRTQAGRRDSDSRRAATHR